MNGEGGDEAGGNKVKDEKGEDGLQAHALALFPTALFGLDQRQDQGDGDDGQGTGELYSDGLVQRGRAQPPHAVPGGGGSGDGRGVIHSRSSKNTEGFPGGGIEADGVA